MEYENLKNTEYASSLHEALVARRDGTLDMATDAMLANMLYSIAQWSIADLVREGKLWRTFSQDPDFQSEVLLYITQYIDKANLEKSPKQVLKWLYFAGRSRCIRIIKSANSIKRKHMDVSLDDVVLSCDFFGHKQIHEECKNVICRQDNGGSVLRTAERPAGDDCGGEAGGRDTSGDYSQRTADRDSGGDAD